MIWNKNCARQKNESYIVEKTNLFLLILGFLMMVLPALPDPVSPSLKKRIALKNGTSIETQVVGDEFAVYYYDKNSGVYYEESPNGSYIPIDTLIIKERCKRRQIRLSNGIKQQANNSPYGIAGYSGEKTGLVILIEFSDVSFSPNHSINYYKKILNERNLQDDKLAGSVKDYFWEQSNGQFNLSFDVIGPIRMPKEYTYYGTDITEQGDLNKLDANIGEMVVTACQKAEEEVDFSKYDWDGDGVIEQIGFIYSGTAQSSTGLSNDIWPQKSTLDYYGLSLSIDGVEVNSLFISSEYRTVQNESGIGTFCHEFSHCMGLPDTYNMTNPELGTGKWDLMGDGAHNMNGFVPAGYTAFDKMCCGWISPIELIENQEISDMKALSQCGNAYMISNKAFPREFFLLENRQKVGFDKELPGKGLIIFHIDFDPYFFSVNSINSFTHGNTVQRCKIIIADGEATQNRQGCCYPTNDNNSFTNSSNPASTLNHINIDGTYFLGKPINNITLNEEQKTISFTFVNEIEDQEYNYCERNVLVKTEGTLSSEVGEDTMFDISRMIVSGNLNGTDILVLRKMAGRDLDNHITSGSLIDLEMSDVSFVEGGDIYCENYVITDANNFPNHGMYWTNIKRIVLPKSIYRVDNNAFEMCTLLEEVIMSDNIKQIGFAAFNHCHCLKSIELPCSLQLIESYAFANSKNLKEVVISAIIPPKAYDNSFSEECYNQATLFIPQGTKDIYKKSSCWKNFVNVVELESLSVSNIQPTEGNCKIFSLDGTLHNSLQRGINIVSRSDGQLRKLIVR